MLRSAGRIIGYLTSAMAPCQGPHPYPVPPGPRKDAEREGKIGCYEGLSWCFKSSFNPEIEGRNLRGKRKIKVTYNESLFHLFFLRG